MGSSGDTRLAGCRGRTGGGRGVRQKWPRGHQALRTAAREGDERIRTAGGGFADPWLNHLPTSPKSGRRDSNPRRPAWEAGILPLNYSRRRFQQVYSTGTPAECQASEAVGSGRLRGSYDWRGAAVTGGSDDSPRSSIAFRVVIAATSASGSSRSAARWRAMNGR
jgi:hypothetical protein